MFGNGMGMGKGMDGYGVGGGRGNGLGNGLGRGRGLMDCCCGRNHQMPVFMETCLLVLLVDQTCHGYSLAEQLGEFGFADVNVSTLYRIMRKMEDDGWVRSSWEEGEKGPQKRVYAITDVGLEALSQWAQVFENKRAHIDKLIAKYHEKVGM